MNSLYRESNLGANYSEVIEKPGFFGELAAQFRDIFVRELPRPSLGQLVAGLGIKIGLNRRQRVGLQQQARVLAQLLADSSRKQLDETMLVSVLQGGLIAGEQLVGDFDANGNHQRPVLIKTLSGLAMWFKALSRAQQEKILSMQQRPFRMSMG